jgi:hypothetical protein
MNSKLARFDRVYGSARLALLIVVLVIGLVAAAVYFWHPSSTRSAGERPPPTTEQPRDELDAAQGAAREDAQPVAPRSYVPIRRSQNEPAGTATSVTNTEASPASPEAQEAVARLSSMEVSSQPLTPDQAAAIKQDLQRLVSQGASAVPAIRQFLEQNKDLSLDEMKGGSPVGYSSLRTGMFDALRQIGGPEAKAALAGVLGSTADPAEIAQLARSLEELAPGQYREQAVSAARETLSQIAENKTKVDVGPLFQTLQTYGGPNVVNDLQNAIPQWQYYATMALAGLPDGQGVRALIDQAQQSGSNGVAKNTFAMQMLAQIATQYPDASAALLEEAKTGQIPDRAWRRVAEALAGDQYQFTKDPGTDMNTLMRTPGVKTYHIGNTDENFYSVPVTSNPTADDVAQRSALIDKLLEATSNPAATDALQKAKSQLVSVKP